VSSNLGYLEKKTVRAKIFVICGNELSQQAENIQRLLDLAILCLSPLQSIAAFLSTQENGPIATDA